MTLSGTLQKIEELPAKVGTKKIVHLSLPFSQMAFIEFRKKTLKERLNDVNIGDEISIDIRFEGKISNISGTKYNNVIANQII